LGREAWTETLYREQPFPEAAQDNSNDPFRLPSRQNSTIVTGIHALIPIQ
jgi:hypothetical protein